MNDLEEIRREIDSTDRELVRLFERRMELCRQVARVKMAMGKQVLDQSREELVLASRSAMVEDEQLAPAVRELFIQLMSLSRQEQAHLIKEAGYDA